jgi:hypothetical protein
MSVVRHPLRATNIKADVLNAAVRRLYSLFCFHAFICVCIVFAQARLRVLTPTAGVFLMNVNLFWLAERSWKVQARHMHVWHPLVQLFFCVARLVHGAAAVFAACVWVKIVLLCVGVGGWWGH